MSQGSRDISDRSGTHAPFHFYSVWVFGDWVTPAPSVTFAQPAASHTMAPSQIHWK